MRPTAADDTTSGTHLGGTGKSFLADLTGRRAWLGALVLIAAYLTPVAAAWVVVRAAQAGAFGDTTWLGSTLALTLGLGLFLALTVRFGGWFQLVSFGEEYMESFRPLAGFALGWLRFFVQVAAFIAVVWLAGDADDPAKAAQMNDTNTAALPAYARRAPIPEGWEPVHKPSLHQNEYLGRPNATYSLSFIVPGSYRLSDVEAWMNGSAWAAGADGTEPFGSLSDVECDSEYDTCAARVTPRAGDPGEYAVSVRLKLDAVGTRKNGEVLDANVVTLEVEYKAHAKD